MDSSTTERRQLYSSYARFVVETELYDWSQRCRKHQICSLDGVHESWLMGRLPAGKTPSLEDVSRVVQTDPGCASNMHRVELLQDIMHGETLENLLQGNGSSAQKLVAMVISGKSSEGRPNLDKSQGALTATQLVHELLGTRYVRTRPESSELVYPERRLIYIIDLDCCSILALVGSAPEFLFRMLGDFVLNYLCATAFMGVSFAPDGPETFCLQFSLPFYVWRSSKRHSVDPRTRKSNGKRLRVSREMTSLEMFAHNRLDTSDIDVIYQSHISCIVTGYDQRHWTAILAVDHWFEQELDDAEFSMPDSLERYQDDIDCGLRTDPLSRGQDDAEISRWTPRPYFLRIMGIRLTQVIKEWEGLMYHIEKILQGFAERQKDLQNQEQFLNGACRGISANGSEENTFLAKVLEFRGIVSDINDALRKTIRSGDSFLESDIFWFYPGQEPMSDDNDCQSQLVQIRRLLQGVRRLGEQFRDMEIALQNMSQDAEKLREKLLQEYHCPQHNNSVSHTCHDLSQFLWLFFISALSHALLRSVESTQWLPQVLMVSVAMLVMRYTIRGLRTLQIRMRASIQLFERPAHGGFLTSVFEKMDMPFGFPASAYANETEMHRSSSELSSPFHARNRNFLFSRNHNDGQINQRLALKYVTSIRPSSMSSKVVCRGNDRERDESHLIGLIPVCVRRSNFDSTEMEQNSMNMCHDDKSFFLSLKQLVPRRSWMSWAGLLSRCGFKKVVDIRYVKFELGDGGLVRILQRDILPPASLNGSYCPTTGSSSPFPSENLLACLKDPSILLNGTRNVLDRVVCKKDGPLQLNDSPCVGYGLLLEEGISHRQLKISRILCVVFSYLFGLSWAASTGKILVGLVVGNCLAILSLVLIRKVLSTCLIAPSSVASLTG